MNKISIKVKNKDLRLIEKMLALKVLISRKQ